jgi:cytochrome c-type biogenesis protein CcmE
VTEAKEMGNPRVMARPGLRRRTKYLIGGAIILSAVVYLLLAAARGATTYYLTVGELKAHGPSTRIVRVSGNVVGGSIVWSARELLLEFEISDTSGKVPAIYHGSRPDMFRDDAEVVLEGKYTAEGRFQAQKMLLKCPSKYEEAQ